MHGARVVGNDIVRDEEAGTITSENRWHSINTNAVSVRVNTRKLLDRTGTVAYRVAICECILA